MATFVYSALESTAEEVVGLCCQGLAGFDALVLDHAIVLLNFTMKPDSVWYLGALTLLGHTVFYSFSVFYSLQFSTVFLWGDYLPLQ